MKSSNVTRRSVLLSRGRRDSAACGGDAHSPVMSKLSAYMSEAGTGPLPEEAVEKTKQHILDTFAAMVSGSELPPGRFAHQVRARAFRRKDRDRRRVGRGLRPDRSRDCSNGMLAHSDETDDSHAPSQSHPGCFRGARCARGWRAIRYRWLAIHARGRARLRRRTARDDDARRGRHFKSRPTAARTRFRATSAPRRRPAARPA